jgi:hypothetical protein
MQSKLLIEPALPSPDAGRDAVSNRPAMTNGRCRMHGGMFALKHGRYTAEAIEWRRMSGELGLTSVAAQRGWRATRQRFLPSELTYLDTGHDCSRFRVGFPHRTTQESHMIVSSASDYREAARHRASCSITSMVEPMLNKR